jgi:hypothetical protein
MAAESKTFISDELSKCAGESIECPSSKWGRPEKSSAHFLSLFEVGLVLSLILAAIWTQLGVPNSCFIFSAILAVVAFSLQRRFSANELGMTRPLNGTVPVVLIGAALAVIVHWSGMAALRVDGPAVVVPMERAWQYAIWALLQEFLLLSFFFVRLESVVGSKRAVLSSALLFAATHVPNPVLTVTSFLGGLLFCEMFRRWRNLFPIGLIHAGLGLTIAASFPDAWLHQMRVGVGFLSYHP